MCAYIHVERVDEFLELVSDSDGRGYERWRYTLIEDKQLPTNSPEALLSIWDVCVQIAESRLWDNQKVRMPDKKLTRYLLDILGRIKYSASVTRFDEGQLPHDISTEIKQWLLSEKHPLNAFAKVLWHYTRYNSHGVAGTSQWLSDVIMEWVRQVLECDAVKARTLLRAFVKRSQGLFPGGESIRWNTENKRFENIPWSLSEPFRDNKPVNAIAFEVNDLHSYPSKIQRLRGAAKECGYHVSENMSFDRETKERDVWLCIFQVTENRSGKIKPILSIWKEHRHTNKFFLRHDVFYFVKECSLDEMEPPIQRWIDYIEILEGDIDDEDIDTADGWEPA